MAKNVIWRGKAVGRKAKRNMGRNILMAAEILASHIRGSFPASGAEGTRSGGGDASNPSEPGGIPHVQTAHLKRNIGVQKRGISSARVGTGIGSKESVGYALALEKGADYKDGHHMAARPFMVPGLKDMKQNRKFKTAIGGDVI